MSQYVTVTSDKSRLTALILCIFLGGVGAHYFYVGRISRGILCWVTIGNFFGVGWIIDIIRVALGTFRDNTGQPLREWT